MNVLEVMAATGGALALMDRLAENPKGRNVKRKFSAAQIKAQKEFAAKARSGAFRKKNPGKRMIFDKAASMAEKDIRRRHGDTVYTLENYARGWILRAGGVAIGGPYETKEKGLAALNAVAPSSVKSNPVRSWRVRFDFAKYQPRWGRALSEQFGERNEGFVIEGETAREAIEAWNSAQLPGNRLNPFYLKITEETKNNPRGRSKRGVTRVSQATGRKPGKRLVARRKATKRAPKGFFANPARKTPARQYVVQIKQNRGGEWITTTMHDNKGPAFTEAKRLHATNPRLAIRAVPYALRFKP
jgi:hypothetical protein